MNKQLSFTDLNRRQKEADSPRNLHGQSEKETIGIGVHLIDSQRLSVRAALQTSALGTIIVLLIVN